MANTILLDRTTWDLVIDADNDIAVAAEPYALAQDAASAVKTFLGECWWDTTVGVPYMTTILGKNPPLALIKNYLQQAALTVPDVTAATVFISSYSNRVVSGQVQVTGASTSTVSAANFETVNPQVG